MIKNRFIYFPLFLLVLACGGSGSNGDFDIEPSDSGGVSTDGSDSGGSSTSGSDDGGSATGGGSSSGGVSAYGSSDGTDGMYNIYDSISDSDSFYTKTVSGKDYIYYYKTYKFYGKSIESIDIDLETVGSYTAYLLLYKKSNFDPSSDNVLEDSIDYSAGSSPSIEYDFSLSAYYLIIVGISSDYIEAKGASSYNLTWTIK